jgi:hypothetical protein
MSKSNENSTHLVHIPLGSITADGSLPALYLPKKCRLVSAAVIDGAGIAADNSNYVTITLQNGSTVIASLDSRAANQGALTALVGKAMSMVSAEQDQAAGSSLKVVYDETGTVAMTNAVLVLEMFHY